MVDPGLLRGDILTIILGGHVVVLDCVVTHPVAWSYLQSASQAAVFAATWSKKNKAPWSDSFLSWAEEFSPLSLETFGRLGHKASHFLFELGDATVSCVHIR